MFRIALSEKGIPDDGISINHATGQCFHPLGNMTYSVIFPLAWVRKMRGWDAPRPIKYVFIGIETDKRQWVKAFTDNSEIRWTSRGREMPKDEMDLEYVDNMRHAQFALCPSGDYAWTHRFLEACFCGCVPIVDMVHPMMDGYKFLDPSGTHEYNEDDAHHNFRRAFMNHTLP